MLQGSSGGIAMILENQRVAEALVVLQIQHAIAIGPQHFLDGPVRKRGQRALMIGRFDDHFVRAHAVHAVEQAFALAIQVAFDSQRGKFIGDHANGPAGRIRPAAVARHRPGLPAESWSHCRSKTGKSPVPLMRTLSRTKSDGRLARSVEMITQRPVIGSFSVPATLPPQCAGRDRRTYAHLQLLIVSLASNLAWHRGSCERSSAEVAATYRSANAPLCKRTAGGGRAGDSMATTSNRHSASACGARPETAGPCAPDQRRFSGCDRVFGQCRGVRLCRCASSLR